jgi:hypothetical protein
VRWLATAVGLVWVVVVATVSPSATSMPRQFRSIEYADGAPPGFSGAFGENSCHACHFEADVNTNPGQVAIDGLPERYAAGVEYPLTVILQRPGMTTGGLQLTARFRDSGAQAGSFTVAPGEGERLKVDVKDGVQYVNQRSVGATLTSPGGGTWTVGWTAPPAGGGVRFDVAANAGNRDESASGDHVFTIVQESAPAAMPSGALPASR